MFSSLILPRKLYGNLFPSPYAKSGFSDASTSLKCITFFSRNNLKFLDSFYLLHSLAHLNRLKF